MDPTVIVQTFLFAFFAGLTAILSTITGPTYDNLFVPEMDPSGLYPHLGFGGGGPGFLGTAAGFSDYLLANLVDPLIVLVVVGIGLLYLARSVLGRDELRFRGLVPKLVGAVILANFTVPVAGLGLELGGAMFPVVAGFDGGAWQHWMNLAGIGEVSFSWDNGALAFVITFALFSIVLLLAIAVALRNALLAVLLVLLPVLTLLWPIPALAPLARRAWMLFGELVFLPCAMVVPLELAVGSSSILELLAFLTVSLSSPWLLSVAGHSLTGAGFPSAGSAITSGVQRGMASASSSVGQAFGAVGRIGPVATAADRDAVAPAGAGAGTTTGGGAAAIGRNVIGATGRLGQLAGRTGFPASAPLIGAELLGRGAAHLLSHVGTHLPAKTNTFPPVRPPKENPP